jgi:hypothetical protein
MSKIVQYDILFSSGDDFLEFEGILHAGHTVITFDNPVITENSTIDVYPGIPNVYPISITSITGILQIEFEPQAEDMKVKVRLS